jgi:hypothetical protein
LAAPLLCQYAKYGQKQKITGNQKVIDFMSDSKGIASHKESNDSEDDQGNGDYATDPGDNCK